MKILNKTKLSEKDVTIIIPIYCKSYVYLDYLKECIESALATGARVLAHDDGSLVDVDLVMKNYNVPLTKTKKNYGSSSARNTLASKVKTEFFIPLDCDDRIKKDGIRKLLNAYEGYPVYGNLAKFELVNIEHYALPDFMSNCNAAYNVTGIASVNVLQTPEMWLNIGGWDEDIDYLEDSVYNAKLFLTYCATHIQEPIVEWRIHKKSKTQLNHKRLHKQHEVLKKKVSGVIMACPGCKGRRNISKDVLVSESSMFNATNLGSDEVIQLSGVNDVANAPLEFNGKVLVQYIDVAGKGRGKHYIKGDKSKRKYKVTFGDYLYVLAEDVDEPSASFKFKRVTRSEGKEPVKQTSEAQEKSIVREPVLDKKMPEKPEKEFTIPELGKDMEEVSIRALREFELTPAQAKYLYLKELDGRARKIHLEHLAKIAGESLEDLLEE